MTGAQVRATQRPSQLLPNPLGVPLRHQPTDLMGSPWSEQSRRSARTITRRTRLGCPAAGKAARRTAFPKGSPQCVDRTGVPGRLATASAGVGGGDHLGALRRDEAPATGGRTLRQNCRVRPGLMPEASPQTRAGKPHAAGYELALGALVLVPGRLTAVCDRTCAPAHWCW